MPAVKRRKTPSAKKTKKPVRKARSTGRQSTKQRKAPSTKKVKKPTRKAKPTGRRSIKKGKTPSARTKQKPSLSTQAAYWKAYHSLQKNIDQAWAKLQKDVKAKVSPKILVKDKNHLLLLLGECNYLARECMRLAASSKKR